MKLLGAGIRETHGSPQGSQVRLLDVPGLIVIEPRIFRDPRGEFLETWQAVRYAELGIAADFVQDNLSVSAGGVLRGLHFQQPGAQAKLVSVIEGEVLDVAVDLRAGSPTFGRWAGVSLDGESRRQFFIPRGFAHGFCALSPRVVLSYKCDAPYAGGSEHCLLWNDPDLGIPWPVTAPLLSPKDAAGLRLRDLPPDCLSPYTG